MITPERLAEIREFADRDVLDLVEPEEMYYFLSLVERVAKLERILAQPSSKWHDLLIAPEWGPDHPSYEEMGQ